MQLSQWCIHASLIRINQSEPTHEILTRFVFCKFILQIRMCSHPVRLDVWFLVWPFVYFQTSSVRTAKALARLRGCAGSPEPSLVAYAISTIISWAGSFVIQIQVSQGLVHMMTLKTGSKSSKCNKVFAHPYYKIHQIWSKSIHGFRR